MRVVVRRLSDGERAPMLLDEQGLPIAWPTLFATVRIRNAGLAFNTIKNKLNELTVLLRWQNFHDRDLVAEFKSGKVLSISDIVSMRDFSAKKVSRGDSSRDSSTMVARFPEASLAPRPSADRVRSQVLYNRMSTIADYLEFLGQTIAQNRSDRDLAAAFDRMARNLRQHRPRGRSRHRDILEPLSSEPGLIEDFVKVGSVGHPENPFRRGRTQRRNELMFRLLLETGIRIGELLSLRLDFINTGEMPNISVRRTHDDKKDSRAYQPVAKTRERIIRISEQLGVDIHRYCMEDRAVTPGANRHPYLFVTHHSGKTLGQPLSVSSVANKIFGSMQRVRPEFSIIHPHSFRHNANYLLSKAVDERNRRVRSGDDLTNEPISEGRELRIRADFNGHSSLSSGETYNQPYTRQVSNEAGLLVQERDINLGRTRQSESDDDA